MGKLTAAQGRALDALGRIRFNNWTHWRGIAPRRTMDALVDRGLAEAQYDRFIRSEVYRINEAGRAALNSGGGDG